MNDAGEKAMALVDGQLTPADVPDLVRELARSESLVAELQQHLATSRTRMASVYAAKSDEPVPQWLSDTIMHGRRTAAGRPAPQAANFSRSLIQWLQQAYRVPVWSLAAGTTLAASVVALAVLLVPHTPTGGVVAETDLGAALERTLS